MAKCCLPVSGYPCPYCCTLRNKLVPSFVPPLRHLDLTHWGRGTHICVGKLTTIGSDNGLSPGRRQTIIWTNSGSLLIVRLGTNFSEILIAIQTFSFKKMHLKMSSTKWRPLCLSLNVLMHMGRGKERNPKQPVAKIIVIFDGHVINIQNGCEYVHLFSNKTTFYHDLCIYKCRYTCVIYLHLNHVCWYACNPSSRFRYNTTLLHIGLEWSLHQKIIWMRKSQLSKTIKTTIWL